MGGWSGCPNMGALFLVILGLAGYRHVAYRPWSVRARAPAFLPRPGPLRSRAPRQHSGLNLSLVLVLVVSARTRFLLNMPRRPQSAPASSILPDSGLNLPLCPQSVLNLASICPSVLNRAQCVLNLSSMRPQSVLKPSAAPIQDRSREAAAN